MQKRISAEFGVCFLRLERARVTGEDVEQLMSTVLGPAAGRGAPARPLLAGPPPARFACCFTNLRPAQEDLLPLPTAHVELVTRRIASMQLERAAGRRGVRCFDRLPVKRSGTANQGL